MKTGAFIIPTGVGATIGGFAGDASFWAQKFAQHFNLIINPNVVNAACFSGITQNMLYVEGYSLDEFFKGNLNLIQQKNNKIGVVFDSAIPQDVLNVHINTINAVKTVYNLDIFDYELTELPVGVNFFVNSSGISMGDVQNPKTLFDAVQKLIKKGANAIAIVCHFPDSQDENYTNGTGVDPVGGVEAIISHYISKEFQIPCAHAPAFSDISICTEIVSPKCAAEYIAPTFLPCILLGLANAPKFSTNIGISINELDFLIYPYDCLGGIPVLEMLKRDKKVYAIKENSTVLDITPQKISDKISVFETYQELYDFLTKTVK